MSRVEHNFYLFVLRFSRTFTFFLFSERQEKTLLSLKKAWKMFTGVLPQFVAILLFVGFALAVLSSETIRRLIGEETGFIGMLLASLVGAVSLVPVMIAFPIVSELLKSGAGIIQMAVFVSTLTTVGLITIPIETKYLSKKIAILRNMLALRFLLSQLT